MLCYCPYTLHFFFFFFFNDTATTEIYTLSLHDALPICVPLCADQFKLVEFGGALVSRIDRESHSAWQFPECAGSTAGHRGLYASLERKPQAVHLERHG